MQSSPPSESEQNQLVGGGVITSRGAKPLSSSLKLEPFADLFWHLVRAHIQGGFWTRGEIISVDLSLLG